MLRVICFVAGGSILIAMVLYIEAAGSRPRRQTDSIQNDSDIVKVKTLSLQGEASHSQITTITNDLGDSSRNDNDETTLRTSALQDETSKSENTTAKNADDGDSPIDRDLILFPDSPKIVGVPMCAQGKTFCETFEKYPDKQVQQVLTSIPDKPVLDMEEDDTAVDKLGDNDEIPVCKILKRTIYPKAGMNKDGKWKYIVNLQQGDNDVFKQGIPVEMCGRQVNAPCEVIGELLNGYVTSCTQKYIYRKLLSLGDDGNPVWDRFSFPSGCYCSVRRRYPFLPDSESPTEPARN